MVAKIAFDQQAAEHQDKLNAILKAAPMLSPKPNNNFQPEGIKRTTKNIKLFDKKKLTSEACLLNESSKFPKADAATPNISMLARLAA